MFRIWVFRIRAPCSGAGLWSSAVTHTGRLSTWNQLAWWMLPFSLRALSSFRLSATARQPQSPLSAWSTSHHPIRMASENDVGSNNKKRNPQNSIGNYLGPYITPFPIVLAFRPAMAAYVQGDSRCGRAPHADRDLQIASRGYRSGLKAQCT